MVSSKSSAVVTLIHVRHIAMSIFDSAIRKGIKHTSMESVKIDRSAQAPRRCIQITEEEPVGFEDDAEKIIHLLIGGIEDLDIISIVGMPGLGKTTLATKIFRDSSIVSHFDVRAWCTISQTYNVTELMFDIYTQAKGVKCNVDQDYDIADILRKCLIGKRYLIVLDDIWEVRAWDELRLCFPNDENGSRIMLTSQLKQVAIQVKRYTDPYCLRFLSIEESWKLLRKKVFHKENCPPELWDVGVKVAEFCKGLPLAIILIGGIIATKESNVSVWCEVADNLKSHACTIETESNEAIQLSFCNLPDHLKPCLLYMGIFPEAAKIRVSRLMLLWMAEGFVHYSDEKRLEEVVEDYLMDLSSSSLIMVSKTTFNGKVKHCKIHGLVRDFCLKKAKEEKFMQVIGLHNQYQPSYHEEHRLCIHADSSLRRNLKKMNNSLDNFLRSNSRKETSFGQAVGSLFITNDCKDTSSSFYSSAYIFMSLRELRLLRVLDLMNFPVNCGYVLQMLVHLRYLGICCEYFNFDWVLPLYNLESLLVNSPSEVIAPPSIWKMTNLRHVNIEVLYFHKSMIPQEKLENLRTIKGMVCFVDEDTEHVMKRFPNLQELVLTLSSYSDFYYPCLKLQVLTKLQSLVLFFPSVKTRIAEFYFPLSLKELILDHAHLSRRTTSTIARLPNLEMLKLEFCTFKRNEWDVRETMFPALKVLKLGVVGTLRKWHVSESSFPVLEILVLKCCGKLEKIPCSFVDVQSLKSIKVIACLSSLKASALKIKEEVEAIAGCDYLEVHVSPDFPCFS